MMRVRFIYHSGFLVETDRFYYLFDYYRKELPEMNREKPVIVLSSHGHADHYRPEVFALLEQRGAEVCLAILSEDIPAGKHPEKVRVLAVGPGENYCLAEGVTLKTLRSTDEGVAFLLKDGEETIYHAGDLNDWVWEGEAEEDNRRMTEDFRREMALLAGEDIQFACVTLDPRQEKHYARGMLWFLEAVGAGRIAPMHYGDHPEVVERFLAEYPRYKGVIIHPETIKEGTGYEI